MLTVVIHRGGVDRDCCQALVGGNALGYHTGVWKHHHPKEKRKKERRKNERKRRTVFLRGSYISCFLKVHFTVSLKGSVHKKSALISFVVVVLFFVVVVRVGN